MTGSFGWRRSGDDVSRARTVYRAPVWGSGGLGGHWLDLGQRQAVETGGAMTYRVKVRLKGEVWPIIWKQCFALGDCFGWGLEGHRMGDRLFHRRENLCRAKREFKEAIRKKE